jgi:hypothetical protein
MLPQPIGALVVAVVGTAGLRMEGQGLVHQGASAADTSHSPALSSERPDVVFGLRDSIIESHLGFIERARRGSADLRRLV